MIINTAGLMEIIKAIAKKISENREFLTELDSAIGDADHGINLSKGFKAVIEKLASVKDKDCGTIFKTVGMTLVSTVGGASGPLYGTAFMRAGQAIGSKDTLDFEDLKKILTAALEGIKSRGRAQKGEKTIVDALEPAADALNSAAEWEEESAALEKVLNAARLGMEHTKDIVAKKGRASYLGERSIGHQDPGATSCYLMLQAAVQAINQIKNADSKS
jgi:dihydroxyacetone kinase-like protein